MLFTETAEKHFLCVLSKYCLLIRRETCSICPMDFYDNSHTWKQVEAVSRSIIYSMPSEKEKCFKSLPTLMKNTPPGNYNACLNNPQKAAFVLKQVLILETYNKDNEIFSLTESRLTISSAHLISDSSSVLTKLVCIFILRSPND